MAESAGEAEAEVETEMGEEGTETGGPTSAIRSKRQRKGRPLKAVDGGAGTPILTISGRDKEGKWLEVIHSIHGKKTVLIKVPLDSIKGRWLQMNAYVNYSNDGQFDLIATDMTNGRRVINLSLANIDMLRGEGRNDFVRPKWGIYRSLRSKEMLREEEEKVFFADFVVQKLQPLPKP